jgi:hypothetical protein
MIDTVTATLSGTVEKIMKPSVHGEPEKAQIAVEVRITCVRKPVSRTR